MKLKEQSFNKHNFIKEKKFGEVVTQEFCILHLKHATGIRKILERNVQGKSRQAKDIVRKFKGQRMLPSLRSCSYNNLLKMDFILEEAL